ncbi:MAG: RNA methyltransferase [Flavobacteriales bacterium]|nr:RNA methyltransferase [Flavobacteriales bacterium]
MSNILNKKETSIIIILDNIRSLNNIGSIFRTSDAFNIDKIILCGICGKPPHREINKTALGATEFVNWEYYNDVKSPISKLINEGYEITSVEQTKRSINLTEYKPKNKVAYVFGNEVNGVSKKTLDSSNLIVEIPQFGNKKSMNVTVCAGIVLWDFYNKKRV